MDDNSVSLTTSPPGGETGTTPDLGPIGRIVGVYFNPRRTFESMRERPRFLLAAIIVAVVQLAIAVLIVQSGIARDEAIASMERQGADPSKIEAVEKFFDSPVASVITVGTSVVGIGFAFICSAALLFFMGNLMLGAKLRFPHYVSATVFGWLVMLVDNVVRSVLILVKHGYDVRLGAGSLFGEDIGYLGRLVDGLTDPLLLWATAITALGVSVFARKKFGFGVLAVLPAYLLGGIMSGFRQ